jgi:hypothetical protein
VVWDSNDTLGDTIGADVDVLFARSTDGGASWSPPSAVHDNAAGDTGADSTPEVACSAAGTWVAAWHGDDPLAGPVGSDFDILYVRSTDGAASWSGVSALNSNAVADSGGDFDVHVVPSPAGTWLAVWSSQDSLGAGLGSDDDIVVARSTDEAATWSAVQALATNASQDDGDDFSPRVATDGAGNWAAVWSSNDALDGTIGEDFDILWARSVDDGITWFDTAALDDAASDDAGDESDPQIATDMAGHWVVVFSSDEDLGGTAGTDHDVFAITGSGPDRDGDGLLDVVEVTVYGTDPGLLDTDGDGLSDSEEIAGGSNPLNPNDPVRTTDVPAAGAAGRWLLFGLLAFAAAWRQSRAS